MEKVLNLTVKEKTLIHLLINGVSEWGLEVPRTLSQKGISKGVGVSRSHISQTLISLEKEGMVKSEKRRIEGQKRKKKTYKLTQLGRNRARELYDNVIKSDVKVREDDKEEIKSYQVLLDESDLSVLELYNSIEDGVYREIKMEKGEELEEGELEEEERKKERYKNVGLLRSGIGLAILLSSPLIILLNELYLQSGFYFLYSVIAGVVGFTITGWSYTFFKERNRIIEQCFSTIILFLVFVFLFLFDVYRIEPENVSQLSYFGLVIASLVISFFYPLETIKRMRSELAYISSPILILYGLSSYIFYNFNFSSEIWAYWLFAGIFMLDAGYRWAGVKELKNNLSVGIGMFIILEILFLLLELTLDVYSTFIGVIWIITGVLLISIRFIPKEKRSRLYDHIWKGLPFTFSILFSFLGLIFIVLNRYMEALIEFLLSFMFLYGIVKSSENWKKSLLFGAPLALLIGFTILILFIL